MTVFFRQVDTIQADIATLKETTAQVNKFREDFICAILVKDEVVIRQQIQQVTSENNKRAKQVKDSISQLKQDTEKLEAKGKLTEGDKR